MSPSASAASAASAPCRATSSHAKTTPNVSQAATRTGMASTSSAGLKRPTTTPENRPAAEATMSCRNANASCTTMNAPRRRATSSAAWEKAVVAPSPNAAARTSISRAIRSTTIPPTIPQEASSASVANMAGVGRATIASAAESHAATSDEAKRSSSP